MEAQEANCHSLYHLSPLRVVAQLCVWVCGGQGGEREEHASLAICKGCVLQRGAAILAAVLYSTQLLDIILCNVSLRSGGCASMCANDRPHQEKHPTFCASYVFDNLMQYHAMSLLPPFPTAAETAANRV